MDSDASNTAWPSDAHTTVAPDTTEELCPASIEEANVDTELALNAVACSKTPAVDLCSASVADAEVQETSRLEANASSTACSSGHASYSGEVVYSASSQEAEAAEGMTFKSDSHCHTSSGACGR